MSKQKTYKSPAFLARRIRKLRGDRRQKRESLSSSISRKKLTANQRSEILKKTDSRCHMCGGKIKKTEDWQADHVYAHSMGGSHSVDNYLPAHELCNKTRWHYQPEEIQWIMKMGVWLRGQIHNDTDIGRSALEKIWEHETQKSKRRK